MEEMIEQYREHDHGHDFAVMVKVSPENRYRNKSRVVCHAIMS